MAVEDPRAEEGSQGQQQSRQTRRRNSSSLRAESKGAKILELIGGTKGATLTDIMKATEWQAQRARFFPTAAKKHGVKIESTKNKAGERV